MARVTRQMAIEALHEENATCPECGRRLTWGCGHEEAQMRQIRRRQDAMRRAARPRTYRGWTIERTDSGAWWVARKLGCLSLKADTLDGMREIIRAYPNGI